MKKIIFALFLLSPHINAILGGGNTHDSIMYEMKRREDESKERRRLESNGLLVPLVVIAGGGKLVHFGWQMNNWLFKKKDFSLEAKIAARTPMGIGMMGMALGAGLILNEIIKSHQRARLRNN